jgi:hypothetical protein
VHNERWSQSEARTPVNHERWMISGGKTVLCQVGIFFDFMANPKIIN